MRSTWSIVAADVGMVVAFIFGLIARNFEVAFMVETVVVLLLLEHFYIGPQR